MILLNITRSKLTTAAIKSYTKDVNWFLKPFTLKSQYYSNSPYKVTTIGPTLSWKSTCQPHSFCTDVFRKDNILANSTRLYSKNSPSTGEGKKAKMNEESESNDTKETVSKAQMLKKAVAEYGSTVIIFHVTISLVSLGVCYLAVSSGLDVGQFYHVLGLEGNKMVQNAGTFVAAYAIHKVMAPVRISITLGATPLIVRYLRNNGMLKK